MSSRAVVLGAVLILGGCRAPRPASIEGWRACLVERGHVSRTGDVVEVSAGAAPVLYLHARWGQSPFVSEHSVGYLMAELGDLSVGAVTRFEGGAPPAAYREGGQLLSFDTDRIEGVIGVLRAGPREVVLDVDVRAVAPTIDVLKVGSVRSRGTITATRVRAARDCH